MSNIKFNPWVGKNYTHSKFGKRVLVLGESHYCANAEEAVPSLTQDVINDLFDSESEFEGYKNTYTKFIRALSGTDVSRFDVKPIWDEVMFYNYVQFPISGARVEPTSKEFIDSEPAFWEVMEQYRPDVVIVWGHRLYNNLPKKGYQGHDCAESETWVYQLKDGKEIRFLPVCHPSAAFDPYYWHNVISAFINNAE